ncbi:MAG: hypothetical protein JRF41_09310 [Deltaproteobacteria bacterium]|nr:hypothetical protein [Deltaproteobacteria bacterium]
MKGFEQTARKYGEMLDSGDHTQIREIIEIGLGMLFGSVMATSSSDMEEFINMVSDALTSEQMRQSSFFKGLKKLFDSVAEGDLDAAKMADIMDLIAPMLDAIISHWICKYNKPVITTTFNEAVSRIGEGGHYPYSNAERASKVLAKLVEYAEFLESEGKKKAH